MIEWGSISYPSTGTSVSSVTFPKNPITVIAVFVSEENTQTGGTEYRGGTTIKYESVSSTGMKIERVGSVRKLYWMMIAK